MGYKVEKGSRYAVIGNGSWATALVKILLENELEVGWHVRREEDVRYIIENGTNPKYLRDVLFDVSRLQVDSDINRVMERADVVIFAVPSAFLKSILEPLTVSLDGKFLISAIKGIVPENYITVAEFFNQEYGVDFDRLGIITGPCHAEEIALERLSYLTVVCKERENAVIVGESIASRYVSVTHSTDIYGTEYSSILKNIYAIAVGMALGLGYGDNFMAVLICNSSIELDRFLTESYHDARNTGSSAYLGDLLVTCYSPLSRNRSFGQMIGRGYPVKSAQIIMGMIAEGYYASECVNQINKRLGVDMPIADAVYRILYEGAPVANTIRELTKKLV